MFLLKYKNMFYVFIPPCSFYNSLYEGVDIVLQEMTSSCEKSSEIETVIDRHLSQQTQLTTVDCLSAPGPELDTRTQPPGVILWDKVLYNRASTASISSINSQQQVLAISP